MDNEYLNSQAVKKAQSDYYNKLKDELDLPYGEGPYDNELEAISGLESSFGKDTEHEPVEEGLQSGSTAVGRFGLMPNTIRDVSKKIGNRETDLGNAVGPETDLPDVSELQDLSDEEITERIKANPVLENKIARLLYLEGVTKRGNNPDLNAYAWQYGNNIQPDQVDPRVVEQSSRIQRFRKLKSLMGK